MGKQTTYSAFEGDALISSGALAKVVTEVKSRMGKAAHTQALIFSDESGHALDFDFHGTAKDVARRLESFVELITIANPGPGRPRLGVVSREVSLLPRQWEWLATQPGGASACLRKLVDAARKKEGSEPTLKQIQERTYRFMSVAAGNRSGYEDALRALYRKDGKRFQTAIAAWPHDVRAYALKLAEPAINAG